MSRMYPEEIRKNRDVMGPILLNNHHDTTELVLKVALNIITLTHNSAE